MREKRNGAVVILVVAGLCLGLSAFVDGKCGAGQASAAPVSRSQEVLAASTMAQPVQAGSTGVDRAMLAAFAVLPEVMASAENPISEEKVTLGRMLYYDERLSKNHDVSCNSCHVLNAYGVDNKRVSDGHRAQQGARNSPTVYNAAGHFVQFWDGRAPTVEEQAKGPILNPVEMAMPDEASVLRVLRSIPGYGEAFRRAFPGEPDPISYDNLALAIGAFERKLVTPSRWDKFLAGDDAALTAAEQRGFNTFVQSGCVACHSGAYLGGQMYQKLGLVRPWPDTKDQGRYEVTKQESDRMLFKVPSLRNVEKTAPCFHDGAEPSLANAVKRMALHQLGRELSDSDAEAIVVWLRALTGELPTGYIERPRLPDSGEDTPKPDPT